MRKRLTDHINDDYEPNRDPDPDDYYDPNRDYDPDEDYDPDVDYDPSMGGAAKAAADSDLFPSLQRASELNGIHPFSDEAGSGVYQYFQPSVFTSNVVIDAKLYKQARELTENRRICLASTELGYSSSGMHQERAATVTGLFDETDSYGRTSQHKVSIAFSRKAVLYVSCNGAFCYYRYDISGYHYNRRICKHAIALLLLLDDYLKKNSFGDSTDWNAATLLNRYARSHILRTSAEISGTAELLAIEPGLEQTPQGLFASFRAGIEKRFVIQSIPKFVKAVETSGTMKFGSKREIDFNLCSIAPESAAIFKFLSDTARNEAIRRDRLQQQARYALPIPELGGRIPLYGQSIDTFYDLCAAADAELPYTHKTRSGRQTGTLKLRDNDAALSLAIQNDIDERGVFHGVSVSGSFPEITRGADCGYYIANGWLNRVSLQRLEELGPLLSLSKSGSVSFHVGRSHLADFYYNALPEIRKHVDVTEENHSELSAWLPPDVSFTFYLDSVGQDITCRIVTSYGDRRADIRDFLTEGIRPEDFRNGQKEKEVLFLISRYFQPPEPDSDLFHCVESEDSVFRFLENGVGQLMAFGEVYTTDRFSSLKIRRRVRVSVGVTVVNDTMNLSISSEDVSHDELLEILYSYREKKKYHRLRNGDFLNLEDDTAQTLESILMGMHISPKDFAKGNMQVPVYRALYLDQMLAQSEALYANRDSRFRRLIREFDKTEDADFEVPATLEPVMRNYQVAGYRWMQTLAAYGFGGILADDMGLGKTLQAISVLLDAAEHSSGDARAHSLIVTPASLVYNWREEFRKFAPSLRVETVTGTQRERRQKIQDFESFDVLITSYDLLKRDVAEYEDIRFHYQILDEAQYIKTHTTAAAKAVKVINSRQRYALTGTPIENRLSELWSIFDFLMPGFLYGYETFRKELETPIARHRDEDAIKRLQRMVSPFILRRLKGDVLKDLPEKIEEVQYVKFDKKQQHLYDGQVVLLRNMLGKQSDQSFRESKLQILAELMKLRQICCDPALLFENYDGGSAKRESCIELIRNAIEGGHKLLLFSQFTSMLTLLEEDLNRQGICFFKITGQTKKEERLELVQRFNGDDTPLFLISLKAGGLGLNLTGADVVIHYDPWWNLAVQNQATDRAHRIGQTKVVSVHKLIVKDSIEEKILQMQDQKKDLADLVMTGDTGGFAALSREELLELIQ